MAQIAIGIVSWINEKETATETLKNSENEWADRKLIAGRWMSNGYQR